MPIPTIRSVIIAGAGERSAVGQPDPRAIPFSMDWNMTGIDSALRLPPLYTDTVSPLAIDADQATNAEGIGEQFESVFWSLLIKTMRSTVSEDGLFAGDKSDTWGGMFDLFMSQHLAAGGALGISEIVDNWQTSSKSPESG